MCAGGSGGAAHSSWGFVAAAAEAERPEGAGAAAGSGEETTSLNRPQWALHLLSFIVKQYLMLSSLPCYQNGAVPEAEVTHICTWSTSNLFFLVVFLGSSGKMRAAITLCFPAGDGAEV